jgi:hypothetical protein
MEDQNTDLELKEIEQEYKREIAIVKARPIVHKIVIGLWIIFDVFLLGIFIFMIASYLSYWQFSDRASTANLVKNLLTISESVDNRSASSLYVSEPIIIKSGDSYDFSAWITNDNTDWYAQFDYHFSSNVGDSQTKHGYIFPGESKPFITLGQEFDGQPNNPEFIVSDIEWTRLDAHLVGDLEKWYSQHNNFVFNDVMQGSVLLNGKSVASSSFTIQNNTPYGYWSAPFILLLQRNGVVVGINQFSVAGFESGESRQIQVNWFDNAVFSGDLLIIPDIDYLDEAVYMPAIAQTEVDIRD